MLFYYFFTHYVNIVPNAVVYAYRIRIFEELHTLKKKLLRDRRQENLAGGGRHGNVKKFQNPILNK